MSDGPHRPTNSDDRDGWRAFWAAQGMPWRTEPEIDEERQRYLAERRDTSDSHTNRGWPTFLDGYDHPFAGISLTRADVEWLLASHDSGRGPVDWTKPEQRGREGLDLCFAHLRGLNLSNLPLAGLRVASKLNRIESDTAPRHVPRRQRGADMLKVDPAAYAVVTEALLRVPVTARLMPPTDMRGVNLEGAHLEGAYFRHVKLEKANLVLAHLESAHITECALDGANLWYANLQGASLTDVSARAAILIEAHLEGANLSGVAFAPSPTGTEPGAASLVRAWFDSATVLDKVEFGSGKSGSASLGGVRWGGANLTEIDWERVEILGDEPRKSGPKLGKDSELSDYKQAVRANRQVATVLREQGLNEHADRFAYRGQFLQRQVLRRQGRWGAALGSWLLDLIAGFGYKPVRSLYTYAASIAVFAALYWCVTNDVSLTHGMFTQIIILLGMTPPPPAQHFQGYEAVVVSMTSFHGRGFFQPVQSPGDKVAILAAIEAAVGLLIEITFIATFTQRFFAR